MKRVIQFSKFFLPMVILSVVIIACGIAGLFIKGINFGIDFQAGLIEQIRIAPAAFSLTYDGSQSVAVSLSQNKIDLVVTGIGGDNKTYSFPFSQYPSAGLFIEAVKEVPGVTAESLAPASVPMDSVFVDSSKLTRLSETPYFFHYVSMSMEQISVDEVRDALSGFEEVSVQSVGEPSDRTFQIRLSDDGSVEQAGSVLASSLENALVNHFGEDSVVVVSSDFVGARFSASLAKQAVLLVVGALFLILIYASIRFRWDFAFGAVLAIIHDALIMVAFIVWTRMQFNSTTLAAVLTIVGYSINDTVVIFDRIRENKRLHPDKNLTEILNLSQSECLGRTLITTITTMLAVLSLYFFTSGDIKNFALALIVGLISGVYSTIYIASAFISFVGRFRKDKGLIKQDQKKPVRIGESL